MFRAVKLAVTLGGAIMLLTHFGITTPEAVAERVSGVLTTTSTEDTPTATVRGHNPITQTKFNKPVKVTTCNITLNAPADTPTDTLSLLTAAAKTFTESTQYTVSVKVGTGNVNVVLDPTPARTAATATSGLNHHTAVLTPQTFTIFTTVDARLSDTERTHNYLHEIAHFFGLDHTPHPNMLMSKYTNHNTEITKYETRALNKTSAC